MSRHPVSVVGAWLVTVSAFAFILVLGFELFGFHSNPYLGLFFFVILPMFFVLGLIMIPVGMWLERRREAKGLAPMRWPTFDLNNPSHRRGFVVFLVLTLVNVMIVSVAAFRGLEYMETPQFCGQVCHTVMEPQFTAHLDGPHSRVKCVDCHVGSGAGAFVYYKLNGMRQLAHVIRGTYPRPIPSPVFNLRPARNTCEECHTPEKFHGDKVRIIPQFGDDEKNTPSPTKLLLHTGGGSPRFGLGAGIHWHTNTQTEIEYIATDDKRQVIPYVRVKDGEGKVTEYRTADVTDAQLAGKDRRQMDCIDCHNRPTHNFFASPERAVDEAISRGAISSALPFARREAVAALKASYPDRATADREIEARLRAFYSGADGSPGAGHAKEVDQLVATTRFLYGRNVFPAMNVTWG